MDELNKSTKSRVTRSRRSSIESPSLNVVAKKTRSNKLQDIGENAGNDDFDDAASTGSTNSMKSCKVVLLREVYRDVDKIAHSTRGRRKSLLTEENLAAYSSPGTSRQLRSASVASDGTESTEVSRLRSSRLASSQNTPRKESVAQPTTPARRSSRLISENEKTADSPAKSLPGRRNLRSNSVISDDVSPPNTRRTSTRLAETQAATPKSLKTKVSKIKEPTTPRRSSMRINKSIIATEKIDEEPYDDEDANSASMVKLIEVKTEEKSIIQDKGENTNIINTDDEPMIVVTTESADANTDFPKLSDIEATPKSPMVQMSKDKSPVALVPSSPVILISTTTIETPRTPKSARKLQKVQTPTVEPAEPIETSIEPNMDSDLASHSSKDDAQLIENVIETPKSNAPKEQNDVEPMDISIMVSPNVSRHESSQMNVDNTEVMKIDQNKSIAVDETKDDDSIMNINKSQNLNNFNQQDIDGEKETSMKIDEQNPIIVANKMLDNVKQPNRSTPKSKSRTLNAFESPDVSAMIDNINNASTPQRLTKSPKPMNDSVQSTGFDQMDVSNLDTTPATNNKKSKLTTPKLTTPKLTTPKLTTPKLTTPKSTTPKLTTPKLTSPKLTTPKSKDVSQIKGTPIAEPNKPKTPKSSKKTPQKDMKQNELINQQENIETTNDDVVIDERIKPSRPSLNHQNSSFGIVSVSLSEEINNLVADLETTVSEQKFDEMVETPPIDVERQFDELVSNMSPKQSTDIETVKDDDNLVSESSNQIEKMDTETDSIIDESIINETDNKLDSILEEPIIQIGQSKSEKDEKACVIEEQTCDTEDQSCDTEVPTCDTKVPTCVTVVPTSVTEVSTSVTEVSTCVTEEPSAGQPIETDQTTTDTENPTDVTENPIIAMEQPTETEQATTTESSKQTSEKPTSIETEVPKTIISSTKSQRKSVQIMTPKMDKIQTNYKRIDTPYPDEKSIHEATENHSNILEEKQKLRNEKQAKARDALKKLQESWNKTIKRSSLSNESSNPIDTSNLLNTNNETANESPKKAVVARNKWGISSGIVDSESEDDEDIIPDSEENSDEESDESENGNEFIDDGAEVIEDYESGDSMDEDERREIEENEIDCGMDIGSEDTDEECEDEDEYESDGFIVNDEQLTDISNSDNENDSEEDDDSENDDDDDEEEVVTSKNKKPLRRNVRVLESSSDDEDVESLTSASTDAISVVVEQVETLVGINVNVEAEEKIVEGNKYVTTYLNSEENITSTKTDEKLNSSVSSHVVKVVEVQREVLNTNKADKVPKVESIEDNDVAQVEVNSSTVSEIVNDDNTDNVEQNVPKQQVGGKENNLGPKKIVIKKRTSLPGIERLSKPTVTKKVHRVSLGDLNPNASDLTVAQFKTQTKSIMTKVDKKMKIPTDIDEQENVNLDANTSNRSVKTDASIQQKQAEEENNNQMHSKKDNAHTLELDENSVNNVTSTSDIEATRAKKSKSKRKFVEIDANEETRERPKPKKLLRIINSASGNFIEEPMTPEKKNKFGFRESPLTPINPNFKVQKRIEFQQHGQSKKRKSIYMNDDDDDTDLLLPLPNWKINTQFESKQPNKRSRKLDLGTTEVILKPLESKKPSKNGYVVPNELLQYRRNMLNRAGIPRQDARSLIREQQKRNYRK